jgi:CarD family transcriptional regulator
MVRKVSFEYSDKEHAAAPASVSSRGRGRPVADLVERFEKSIPKFGETYRLSSAALRAGDMIRTMRKGAGLTQGELAKSLAMTQARISELEVGLGTQGPTWDVMERVAAACGKRLVLESSSKSEEVAKKSSADGRRPTPAKDKPISRTMGYRQGFRLNELVVYPAHGVGQIVSIEEVDVAGFILELFVIQFSKDNLTLRVPTSKVSGVGMRKISDPDTARRALEVLTGRARVKRTMWSRRAEEYETKINSGDINAIAEVVRDLYRSEAQPEQSYSERQLYEAALDRMVREIAAVQKSSEIDALKAVEAQLQKSNRESMKASLSPAARRLAG